MIAPAGAAQITLTITELDTEAEYDSIRIWRCSDTQCSSPGDPVAIVNGVNQAEPRVVVVASGYMLVHFTSDGIFGAGGFAASWASFMVLSTLLAWLFDCSS